MAGNALTFARADGSRPRLVLTSTYVALGSCRYVANARPVVMTAVQRRLRLFARRRGESTRRLDGGVFGDAVREDRSRRTQQGYLALRQAGYFDRWPSMKWHSTAFSATIRPRAAQGRRDRVHWTTTGGRRSPFRVGEQATELMLGEPRHQFAVLRQLGERRRQPAHGIQIERAAGHHVELKARRPLYLSAACSICRLRQRQFPDRIKPANMSRSSRVAGAICCSAGWIRFGTAENVYITKCAAAPKAGRNNWRRSRATLAAEMRRQWSLSSTGLYPTHQELRGEQIRASNTACLDLAI